MLPLALLALSMFAPATVDAPASVEVVPAVAPMPREKCDHRGSADCLCDDGDLRCRAKAALSLAAAAKKAVPVQMLSKERIAAKAALQAAETKVKAKQ